MTPEIFFDQLTRLTRAAVLDQQKLFSKQAHRLKFANECPITLLPEENRNPTAVTAVLEAFRLSRKLS